MKRIILVIGLLLLDTLLAANVQWDTISVDNESSNEGWYNVTWPWIDMTGTMDGDVLTLWAVTHNYMEFGSIWNVVDKGDTISVSSIQSTGSHFYNAEMWVDENSIATADYSIQLSRGSSVYLGVICNTYMSPQDYETAWMELTLGENAEIIVVKSAIDLDGDALVVGAIPEPSGGVLLLLGVAILSLRRRI